MSSSEINTVLIVILFGAFLLYSSKSNVENKYDIQTEILKQLDELKRTEKPKEISAVDKRDRKILDDPLYPAVSRIGRKTFDDIIEARTKGLMPIRTQGEPDTFRAIAYLINTEDKDDVWIVFGRAKYPRSSLGTFYASPTNSDKQSIKINLTDENQVSSEKFKDIYNLPKEIQFNSPAFKTSLYKVIEFEAPDLGTSRYI